MFCGRGEEEGGRKKLETHQLESDSNRRTRITYWRERATSSSARSESTKENKKEKNHHTSTKKNQPTKGKTHG